jgi:DNA-binding transcriptional ArsR family regulator
MNTFQALADDARRQIVEALRRGEQPVNDIVAALDIHQSGVSRHLHILRDAGFVQVRSDGKRRLYSLRPERFLELEAWLDSYRELWEARLDRFGEALEKRQGANRMRQDKESEVRQAKENKEKDA